MSGKLLSYEDLLSRPIDVRSRELLLYYFSCESGSWGVCNYYFPDFRWLRRKGSVTKRGRRVKPSLQVMQDKRNYGGEFARSSLIFELPPRQFTTLPNILAKRNSLGLLGYFFLGRIRFPGLIYRDQRWLLFFECTWRLLPRCKICLTLELFANYFSLKSLSLSLKSHMNVP